jgi:dihydroorotate dehydrogenase (fumarate)
MDLTTDYLGLRLAHPFMPGASPLVDNLATVRRLEDAGASAIVMHSLFEEQIVREQLVTTAAHDQLSHSFAEAMTFLADTDEFELGPDEYLEQIHRIRHAVAVPVIASLNGTTTGGWLRYARLIEEAGAHALELNLYDVHTDEARSGSEIEDQMIEIVRAVRREIHIPIAVKLSPFFTSLPHVASRLEETGVNGLVLFNRYFQPDIDVEELEMVPVNLSGHDELPLRLRWLGILHGKFGLSLAASGGIHSAIDAIKAVMCGASAVQLVSTLLRHGPDQLRRVIDGVRSWLDEHEYRSLDELRGSMSMQRCPDPSVYRRSNYIRILRSWK